MNSAEQIARRFLKSHDLEHDDKVAELAGMIERHVPEYLNKVALVQELDTLDKGLEGLLKGEKVASRIMDFRAAIQCVGVITTQVLALFHIVKTAKDEFAKLQAMAEEAALEKRNEEIDATWNRIMGSE